MLKEKIHPMVEIFFEFAQLKNLYRQGWLKRGVKERDCESVAEHSFSMALLAYAIAEEYRPDLDSAKVMKLGLFHDLGEIYAGDITPVDGVSEEEKARRELEGVRRVFSKLKNGEKYVNIWIEYERGESPEAKFAKQADKLETALQAGLYKKMGCERMEEFFLNNGKQINSPELKEILDDIVKRRR